MICPNEQDEKVRSDDDFEIESKCNPKSSPRLVHGSYLGFARGSFSELFSYVSNIVNPICVTLATHVSAFRLLCFT